MKVFEKMSRAGTAAGILIIRFLLPRLSDKFIARLLRISERLSYAFTANEEGSASIAEVAEIFELGPPYSSTTRKIVASMETDKDLALSTLTCLSRPSPYGAD